MSESKKRKLDVVRTNSAATTSTMAAVVNENVMKFLTLNDDCLEAILEWLPPDDLARLSRTCKHLRMLIMEFFPRKFPFSCLAIWNLGNGIIMIPKLTWARTFSHLVRDVRISGEDINIYRCVYKRCNKQLQSLSISSRSLLDEHIHIIVDILKNIEVLTLDDCMVENNLHFSILQHCKHLKRLHLRGFIFEDLEKRGYQHQWLKHTYSQLELLELNYLRKDIYDHLIKFMQRNTTLKTFISRDLNAFAVAEIIKLAHVKLDELLFGLKKYGPRPVSKSTEVIKKYYLSTGYRKVRQKMDELCERFNTLHTNDSYKRLYIKVWHGEVCIDFPKEIKSLKALHGLDLSSAEIDSEELALAIVSFNQLKSLSFYTIKKIEYAEILSRLSNLEEIQIIIEKFDTIYPFIRSSPKLKSIVFQVVRNKDTDIDLAKLSKERTKLPGACKCTLYFEQDTFFTLKSALTQIKYPLLQIELIESYCKRNITF